MVKKTSTTDITAVVLTLGEKTYIRAMKSLERQSVRAEEIVTVQNISPFHKAFNSGSSQVRTEFFVVVDSDMVLDTNCFADLRKCMRENIGIVVGHLRDPLIGRIAGIKMFRRQCLEIAQFRDSISPDTDFIEDISKEGWMTTYALKFSGSQRVDWHTFGMHLPEYTPRYLYSKYRLEGGRYRHRGDFDGFRWHFWELRIPNNIRSLFAQIAMAHGVFITHTNDQLKPYEENSDFNFLESFLKTNNSVLVPIYNLSTPFMGFPRTVFIKFFKFGIELRLSNAFSTFKECLSKLNKRNDFFALIASVGLCHGIFYTQYNEQRLEEDATLLENLLPKQCLIKPFLEASSTVAGKDVADYPGISIIVAVYNAQPFLEKNIQSLLGLDYPKEKREIIFVDNNSTDRTPALLRKYSGEIKIVHETIQGPAAARNKGIQEAAYEIVAFTDSDCEVEKNWLKNLIKPLMRDSNIVATGGKILAKKPCNRIEQYGEIIHDHEKAINFYAPHYLITMNMAIHRGILFNMRAFDERLLRQEDVDFAYRLDLAGLKFHYAPDAIIFHHNEKTLTGLFREGFNHGFWSVKVCRKYGNSLLKESGRNFIGSYVDIVKTFEKFIYSLIVREEDPMQLLCKLIFSIGKKAGKICGSVKFQSLWL